MTEAQYMDIQIVGRLVVWVIIFIGIYYIRKLRNRWLINRKFKQQGISKIITKLEEGKNISQDEILPFAENPKTRGNVFFALANYDKVFLFPDKYLSDSAKSEAMLYLYLQGKFSQPEIENFNIEKRVDKNVTQNGEEIDIFYTAGSFTLDGNDHVFVTGPTLPHKYDLPMTCTTSIDLGHNPGVEEIVETAHKKFLLSK